MTWHVEIMKKIELVVKLKLFIIAGTHSFLFLKHPMEKLKYKTVADNFELNLIVL